MYERATSTTICVNCTHLVVPPGSKGHWYYWQCIAKPRPLEYNPVTGLTDKVPPRCYCKDVNGGDCPFYKAGPNEINPRADADGVVAA